MNQQYSKKVMEHFMNPHNVGEIPDADGIGNVGNPVCGDVLRLYIKVSKNTKGEDVIEKATFKTFGCLPPDEKVVLGGAWDNIASIKRGQRIINGKGIKDTVEKFYEIPYKGRMFTFVPFVSRYNSFSVTPEHPIFALKREYIKRGKAKHGKSKWFRINKSKLMTVQPEYISAGNLKTGDYLVFSYPQEIRDNSELSRNLLKLLGYYLSEGYPIASGKAVAFAFNKKEKDLIKEVEILVRKIAVKKMGKRTRGSVTEIYFCSKKLVDTLVCLGKKGAREKCLSEEIMALPPQKQMEIIRTFWKGDGDITIRRKSDAPTYRIMTASEKLAIQFQEILARNNIFSSLTRRKRKKHVIEGRTVTGSPIYLIKYKIKRRHRFVHFVNNYFLIPIRRIIKTTYNGIVYNLHMANSPNSYLVRGFVVHNCAAAIATSSIITDLITGKTVKEALEISNKAVAEALDGLPPIKMHCSMLAEDALKSAIEDYLKKKGTSIEEFQKKKRLRKEILEKLHNISKKERERKVKELKEKLFSLEEFKKAKCVMFYVSKHYEVDTHEMIDESIAMGKKVVVPITLKEEKMLKPSELRDRKKELVEGHYGVHQPHERHIRPVPLEELGLMVVPGIAFDKSGHRLGHGGGYYDRFLEKVPSSIFTLGLAFDFQIMDELPKHTTDIPVNKVLIS